MTYIRNWSILLPSHEPDDPKDDEASEDTRYAVTNGHNDGIPYHGFITINTIQTLFYYGGRETRNSSHKGKMKWQGYWLIKSED